MEAWHAQFPRLDERSHFNLTLNASAARGGSWTATNGTRGLIASLQLQQVQTLRTMHLTVGVFSLAMILLTVHRIVSDARRAAALHVTLRHKRFNALHNVHPADTFPLALASGAGLQQIIFVAVQSTSLNSVLSNQCRGLSMITLPAIFVVGYITMVFGIETAWRSVRTERFAPRGEWNTAICIAVVSFLLLLTWIPTIAWPMYKRCFGSLIWFPMRYDALTLAILSIMVFFCLLLAAVISFQLMRTSNMDHNERVSASRMSYYLLVVALLYILVMPVEIQSLQRDFMNALAAARVAEISLFATGLVITFFHLFLRTNATRMVIRPIEDMKAPRKQQRPKIRFFGPSDLEMSISHPMGLQGGIGPSSSQGLIYVGPEKDRLDFDPEYFQRRERVMTPNSIKPHSPIDLTKWPLPPDVSDAQVATPAQDRNQRGYSLFPTRAKEVPRLPETVYDPNISQGDTIISKLALRRPTRRGSITNVSEAFDFLTKPRPLFAEKHRRDRSTDSSATVQIGLRFSLAPATLAAAKYTQVERSPESSEPIDLQLQRGTTDTSGELLGLPLQASSSQDKTPDEVPSPSQFPTPPVRIQLPSPVKAPAFPLTPSHNSSSYLQSQRQKVLPAIPPRSPSPLAQTTIPAISGLHMNPITPIRPVASPTTPESARRAPSPTARIPLGAGTMSRSPPPNGWI